MKIFFILTFALSLMMPFWDCSIETGWKNIVVLKTKRADLEKVLGAAAVDNNGLVDYSTDEALIHVIYSVDPCSSDRRERGKFNVQKDTVLWYQVVLKKEINLKEFNWKPDLYERVDDPHMKSLVGYFNVLDGIKIDTRKSKEGELISGVTFERTKAMTEKFQCNEQ